MQNPFTTVYVLILLTAIVAFVGTSALAGVFAFSWWQRRKSHIQSQEKLASVAEEYREYREEAQLRQRKEWVCKAASASYRNETEVEIKFVYPLLHFLGHSDDVLRVRVPVNVQAGRQQLSVQADWVIMDAEGGRARFVIEAKEMNQALNDGVREQARSYAHSLKCPLYAITNGRHIKVFQRDVDIDPCVFECGVSELNTHWATVAALLGKPSRS